MIKITNITTDTDINISGILRDGSTINIEPSKFSVQSLASLTENKDDILGLFENSILVETLTEKEIAALNKAKAKEEEKANKQAASQPTPPVPPVVPPVPEETKTPPVDNTPDTSKSDQPNP